MVVSDSLMPYSSVASFRCAFDSKMNFPRISSISASEALRHLSISVLRINQEAITLKVQPRALFFLGCDLTFFAHESCAKVVAYFLCSLPIHLSFWVALHASSNQRTCEAHRARWKQRQTKEIEGKIRWVQHSTAQSVNYDLHFWAYPL